MASSSRPGSLVPPRNWSVYPSWKPPDETSSGYCYPAIGNHLIFTTIAGLCVSIGLLYTFAGYRLFKPTMFLIGFTFACGLVFLICVQDELLPFYGNVGVAALAGLMFGLITMLVQYVGLFISGLHTGLLLGAAGLVIADHVTETSPKGNVWLCIGVLQGCALVCAILNLYFRKGLTIIGTSLYGAAILATFLDYYMANLATLFWSMERASLKSYRPPPCWFSWIMLISWPTLFVVGMGVQTFATGRGRHHEDVAAGRKKPRVPTSMKSMAKMDRAEMRQKKYRYLYQVRTAHGDIISQNFVQQMQRKETTEQGGGECSTLQSDATHVTTVPDHHIGIMSGSEADLTMIRK